MPSPFLFGRSRPQHRILRIGLSHYRLRSAVRQTTFWGGAEHKHTHIDSLCRKKKRKERLFVFIREEPGSLVVMEVQRLECL